jgi:hypothetical protein
MSVIRRLWSVVWDPAFLLSAFLISNLFCVSAFQHFSLSAF